MRDMSAGQKSQRPAGALYFSEVSRTMIALVQMAVDSCTVSISSFLSLSYATSVLRHEDINFNLYILPTAALTVIVVFNLARSGVYNVFNTLSGFEVLRCTTRRLLEVVLLLTGCFFVLKVSDSFSRVWLVAWSVTSAIGLCGSRFISTSAVNALIAGGKLTKNIAIVGASEAGQRLKAKFAQADSGTRLIGMFDQRDRARVVKAGGDAVVHPLTAIDELLSTGRVDEVIIAIPPSASERVLELSRRFHPFPITLRVLAPEGYQHFQVLDSCRYADINTFRVMSKPLDDVAVIIKWLEDKIIAFFCLLVMLPLILLFALAIKLDSQGPVFFRQKRIGANNQSFNLLKFRSMYVEQADPLGQQLTRPGDPRVTRVGRFLRRTSLDELPQLINVLRGEMSLVGPRPHPLAANAAGVSYPRAVGGYLLRHRVKPGMTGWAQVNGWRGETTRIEQISKRVEHDLYYIENWSLAFDLLILARTVGIVMSRENAI